MREWWCKFAKKTANKTANSQIRKNSKTTATTDSADNISNSDSQFYGQEKQGLLKPQHEQFAQNIAQGIQQFHHLRHFAVSRLAARGGDITHVSRLIGHVNIKTTIDTYGHLFCAPVDMDLD
ncbi:TPA: tyrosine-type recombinase/integrase [Klebsiella aerogenes]|nr:tyrosine-type recombinase/integrase [Klebsiella aerogenes]HBY1540620.1 tyrosine-type recombinase/integrase [Klebsiella aerogenes]HBY1603480.1 tyrosine-type recombinase/integrase [Klebsiella aerogenes]HBY1639884.1 tyrosine-type recombinase/integrase [Klebsiella aerogenes]